MQWRPEDIVEQCPHCGSPDPAEWCGAGPGECPEPDGWNGVRRAEMPRPRCCPEPRCTPLHQLNADKVSQQEPGQSWMCWGKAPEATVFVYDGVEHTNDTRTCFYTPLKGVIAHQENSDDWFLMAHAYAMALWKLVGCPGDAPQRPWTLIKAARQAAMAED